MKYLLFFILPALLMMGAPAKADVSEKWHAPGLGFIDAIADDLDRSGELAVLGLKGGNLALIEGSSGKLKELLGIIRWVPRVADLEGDGKMNIAVAIESMVSTGQAATRLRVYSKHWMGWDDIFTQQGPDATVMNLADIDGDGRIELIGSPTGRDIKAFHGKPLVQMWSVSLDQIAQTALGDIDGDGIIEVIAAMANYQADGQFIRRITRGPAGMMQSEEVRYDLDLIAIRGSDGQIILTIHKLGAWTRTPITADLKNTGSDDIIIFSLQGLNVIRKGAVAAQVARDGGFFGGAVGDFYTNSGLEIVLVDITGGVKAVNGDGTTLWETSLGGPPSGQPVIADIEGDGQQEILIPLTSGVIKVLRGQDGSVAQEISTDARPSSLLVADVDGNGKLDILVAAKTGLTLYKTGSRGDIQWATACGDAQGTFSYRLSRAYVTRVRNPSEFRAFPWSTVLISLGVLSILGLIGLFVMRSLKTVREVSDPISAAAGLGDLEREYAKKREDKFLIRKLAQEYASRNVTDLKAIEVYQKSFKAIPDNAVVRALANAFLVRNALSTDSEEVFKKAIEIFPQDKRLFTGLTTLYSQNKRIDPDSMKIYEKFYYLGLDNPRATANIARELAKVHREEPLAIHLYQRHLRQEPADNDVLPAMLDYLRKIENSAEYQSVAGAALDSPNLPYGMRLRIAKDLMKWEIYPNAEAILKKAVTEKPDDTDAWWSLKNLLSRTERADLSRKAANRLVQIYLDLQRVNPTQADIKMALGKLYRDLGDPAAAVNQFKTIAQHEAVYHEAALMLTELYVELGDPDRAETVFGELPASLVEQKTQLRQKIEQLRSSKIFAATADGAKTAVVGSKTVVEGASPRRYKLINEVGRGGMGVVYKALDTVLNREVAYKILPEDLRDHPKIAESFAREAQALAALSHPNIVTVFDAGQEEGTLFFVMQYIQGTDLKNELKKQAKFPIPKVIDIARQLCRALAYAHEKRIVHRDIKTSNVMMTSDGSVMLMDFGLSKFLEESASGKTAISGTPFYMSPEQTLGEGIDHRTDIYSLGVMLFELTLGHVPFPTGDIGYHHLHTLPQPPQMLDPSIPESLSDIILKCMVKDKQKRYQSANDILKDIDSIRL